MTATTRLPRREVRPVAAAAALSLLLSPITAIWALLLGVLVALVAGALSQGGGRASPGSWG
jgi:ABC-type dipeptide/oligopeptide/nickel transport system permease subunit